jgi:putative ABC transport system permease protein
MGRISRRNLGAHKVRLILTVVSVVLGTAFVAGSFVFTDTLKSTFHTIFDSSYQGVDTRVTARSSNSAGVPSSEVAAIRNTPGVATVQVEASGPVVLIGADGHKVDTGGAPSVGSIWYPPGQQLTEPPTFAAGGPPTTSDQVALNIGAAQKADLTVGSHTTVVTLTGAPQQVTISGIYRSKTDTGGYVGVLFPQSEALHLFTDGQHVQAVDVAGTGVSEQQLRDRIAATLPADLQAKTGSQVRADTRNDVDRTLSFVNYFLLAFGFIALIVGTFIIYNTFSMIVAQRSRELALLRAIGADRGQLRRSVLLEAGVIGAVGSVIGVGAGIGLAYGLHAFLDAINTGLPSGGLVLAPRTVIVAVVLGVAVTMISANAPSRRAGRTAPVAAMRADETPIAGSLRRRNLIGAALTVLGAVFAGLGAISSTAGTAASEVGLALLAVGAGALLLAPWLSRVAIGALGRIFTRPFGAVGRLARTNATRNPRRTAATAFALTLGLLLVSSIAVIGASAKKSVDALVDNHVRADYILTTQAGIPVPTGAAAAVTGVAGIASIVQLHSLDTIINGADVSGEAVDGALSTVYATDTRSGAAAVTSSTMLASTKAVQQHGWRLGQQLTLHQPGGGSATLTLSGTYANDALLGPWIVSGQTYRALTPSSRWSDDVVLVKAATGADPGQLRTALNQATDRYYVVQVQDRDQFKGQQAQQVDGLLAILYGLLGLAIVIAVLGIINTLALSVVERRREIGMLRAVGLRRGQARRMVYLESTMIALFGAVLGVGLGIGFGALYTHTLRDSGLGELSVPWAQALLFLVLAGVVGVLAAIWPAVRAARTRPLAAITEA